MTKYWKPSDKVKNKVAKFHTLDLKFDPSIPKLPGSILNDKYRNLAKAFESFPNLISVTKGE
jgi:hypothetical protein